MSTLLSSSQAGEIIGIDESQVRRYCQCGKLRARKVGRAWLIFKSDAQKFRRTPVGNPAFREQPAKKALKK